MIAPAMYPHQKRNGGRNGGHTGLLCRVQARDGVDLTHSFESGPVFTLDEYLMTKYRTDAQCPSFEKINADISSKVGMEGSVSQLWNSNTVPFH